MFEVLTERRLSIQSKNMICVNLCNNVTGRRRGARILTLTFTRKHSMLIQHGGQHEPRAILFPTIPSVTTRGWGG